MVFQNSIFLWLETIQEVQFEKSLISNILTTTLFTLFCITGVLVNSSILLHIKKRDNRNVDKIIKLHSLLNNFLLITLFLFCLFNALSILKDYTGYLGCLCFSYHQYFFSCYIQLCGELWHILYYKLNIHWNMEKSYSKIKYILLDLDPSMYVQ